MPTASISSALYDFHAIALLFDCACTGQCDAENRALVEFAAGCDRAMVPLHDTEGDRQPEAGALADGLGGEERVENAR